MLYSLKYAINRCFLISACPGRTVLLLMLLSTQRQWRAWRPRRLRSVTAAPHGPQAPDPSSGSRPWAPGPRPQTRLRFPNPQRAKPCNK